MEIFMYQFEDASPEIYNRRFGKAKTLERIALETIPTGKQVVFPKSAVSGGSLRAWAYLLGKERGIRLSVRSVGDEWIVAAFERES
jgi:hypothetical protein